MARQGALAAALQIEPRAADRGPAAELHRAVSAGRQGAVVLRLSDGTELAVPEALMKVLVASAGELSEGHSITVLPSDALLTPSEVAELLGLSRPFVVRLLDAGDIPSERLPRSRHRKVRLADVLAFQTRRERRRQGREAIAAAVTAADLPY
jgi:excisionase family DNA binding protein